MAKEITKNENGETNLEENEKIFLDLFRDLEQFLVLKSNLQEDYISYSRALNKIHHDGLDPIISNDTVYDFLKSASDLRNIISHRNDICLPTSEFVEKFRKVCDLIMQPKLCLSIATRNIISANIKSNILESMKIMNRKGISHLPVLEDGKVIGVFSRSTIFDYALDKKKISIGDNALVEDVFYYCMLENHRNDNYVFVKKTDTIRDVFSLLRKKTAHDKKLGLIFITEHGYKDEKILGILTETDILLSKIEF